MNKQTASRVEKEKQTNLPLFAGSMVSYTAILQSLQKRYYEPIYKFSKVVKQEIKAQKSIVQLTLEHES